MVAVMTPYGFGCKAVAVCVDLYIYTSIAASCQASSFGVHIRGAGLDNEIFAVSGICAVCVVCHDSIVSCDQGDITACIEPEGSMAVPDPRHTTRYTKTVGASLCRSSHGSLN